MREATHARNLTPHRARASGCAVRIGGDWVAIIQSRNNYAAGMLKCDYVEQFHITAGYASVLNTINERSG